MKVWEKELDTWISPVKQSIELGRQGQKLRATHHLCPIVKEEYKECGIKQIARSPKTEIKGWATSASDKSQKDGY